MRWSSYLLSNSFWQSHELLPLKYQLLCYIPEFLYTRVIRVVHIMYKVLVITVEFDVRDGFQGHSFQIMTSGR